MSSPFFRLSRHLCTQTKPPNPKPTPTNSDIKSLFTEPDLTKVVTNFKKFSDHRSFRGRHSIYEKTILRLASTKQHSLIHDLLQHQTNYDDIKREGFVIRLISLYGKAGMPDHAHKLFDEMPGKKSDRTVKSFDALLNTYIQSKKYDDVLKLFRELPSLSEIIPDDRSYNVVIHALCMKRDLDSAEKLLDEMESNGVKASVHTFNILMDGFYSVGKLADGDRVWGRMVSTSVEPDLVSYNGKVKGLVHVRKLSEAVKLLEEIKSKDFKPDIITYNILIRGFVKGGKVKEAKGVYDSMVKSDCLPNRTTYQLLIPCCCQKGDSGLAFELCKECLKGSVYINVEILQAVVNLLVKDLKVEEAKELLGSAYLRKYKASQLKMPVNKE